MPLPDYLEPQTEEGTRERMLARLPLDLDKNEGSYLFDPIMALALELVMAADRLVYVHDLSYVQTTFGEFLDKRGEEHGVARNQATLAKGNLLITGTPGTVIDPGKEFSTAGSDVEPAQVFAIDAGGTIPGGGSITLAATAILAGADGNAPVSAINLQVVNNPAITSVTNSAVFSGGADEETDEAYRARILFVVRNPGSSGNQADYVRWALEVDGVGGASCVPLAGGPGTVTVAIVDTTKRAIPGAGLTALVAAVQAYIAPAGSNAGTGMAPIGAAVTIQAATEVAIDVVADLTYEAGATQAVVQAAIAANLVALFKDLTFAEDNDVRHARIITTIVDTPGVVDATAVTIEGGTSNVAISATQIAVLGTTTWT